MRRFLSLLILVLPLGYCTVVTNLAKSKAEDICSSVPANATVSAAEEVIRGAGIPELKRDDYPSLHEMMHKPHWSKDKDILAVVIPSVLGERWVCTVRLAEGQVSGKEVRLID
jgi:hypothetical protein